jgi:hypothetical protein
MEDSCYVRKQVKAHWYQRHGFARCADKIGAATESGVVTVVNLEGGTVVFLVETQFKLIFFMVA